MTALGGLSTEEINRVMDLEWEESIQDWEWHALNYASPVPLIPFPSYCVSRRCGWCRFVIKPDELVTARSSGGTESSVFTFGDSCDDTKLFATFKRCESDHDACATTGYHVECSTIASNLGLQKNDFSDVARYSYEPSSKEDERRHEWILNHLHQVMSKNFVKLPTEVLLMINEHLVLHYAIASLSGPGRPDRWTIEPLKDVWATHFSLNGIDYIASLSNSPRPGSRLLWRAPDSREDSYLYISEDHLGIRRIVNDPLVVSVEERRSGWWRTLPIVSPILTFTDDGLKLRSVAAAPLNPTICWPYPMAPRSLKSMTYHATKRSSSSFGMTVEARMVTLNFNEPGITAYSTCWYDDCLVDIHTHESGESTGFYHELDEDVKTRWLNSRSDNVSIAATRWVYHPLNRGEKVEQVWLRTKNEPEQGNDSYERQRKTVLSPKEIAVGLLTSHSRTLVMGKPGATRSEWKCIAQTSTGSPTRVFFNPSVDGISLFAAPTVGGSGSDYMPETLSTWLDAEQKPNNSEALLDKVKEVVVCKERTEISGLLFRFADGKQASVGKFRLDHAEAPLLVGGSPWLYTGYRVSDKGESVLEAISIINPGHNGSLEWNKMPLEGILTCDALLRGGGDKTAGHSDLKT
ncbi:hypothetical protein FLAG1_00003 [Fusarium langsethiae]|uniref:Uncharacterized protein n=1 Tax=Fusarium langsethiae TaxID=179993 RepID=A0A0M9F612_FUSLA|nr:hypothetical protein FLAG1_00003 [Fusarium langsethiae]GKU02606.1 unnamed protein product [Fusarium langsethiae]GKU17935.1 unnamed protein product [Fusarium langsethiae]